KLSDGGTGAISPNIDCARTIVLLDVQSPTKEADFVGLGFEVLIPLVQEDKIEDSDAPLNVFEFMFPPVADVLAVDLAVETSGEQVIDRSANWKALGPGVFFGVTFAPESGRARAPMGRGEGQEWT